MSLSIVPPKTPADLAAQELVDKVNNFISNLSKALSGGVEAEGSRPAVSGADLSAALGTALPHIKSIISTGE